MTLSPNSLAMEAERFVLSPDEWVCGYFVPQVVAGGTGSVDTRIVTDQWAPELVDI